MPYIKKDSLKEMLRYFFVQGCNAGYGIDAEDSLIDQEEAAFKCIYEEYFDTTRKKGEG
ncbi:hypothetical protein [Paenibacillus sp. 1781tsa1]|uniref:hypothetical protein n=1 Tax=Paenibacillus sp. 1781tsa1 TaxID=2953810 RepID=UPI0020A1513A|nr:hypothetical protein [Paenibacillus sp. 1781tsa1]MCP1184993.1 hypothetical protein [Paenibacillus sp. 1781tsa1]